MSIKITKKVLEGYLRRSLFEDTYNTYTDFDNGRAGTQFVDEEEILDIPTTPIGASEQMAVQLSTERPPVEDETYIPVNPSELGLAAEAIGQMIPNDQVEYFYQRLKDLWDEALEKAAVPEVMGDIEEVIVDEEIGEELSQNENKLRQRLRRILEQANIDDEEYDEFRQGYGTIEVDEEDEDEEIAAEQAEEDIEGMSLDDLASEFGYGGPSGVRQSLERILGRLNFMMQKVEESDIEVIKQMAVSEFIELMVGEDYIDNEDAEEFLANPSEVEMLDSFRFFLVGGFLLPAYQSLLKNTTKRVEAEIETLGLPQRSKQTLKHQVFGNTPKNPEKLRRKILKDAAAEGMEHAVAEKIVQQVQQAFKSLEGLAAVEGDLITLAIDGWNKSSRGRKKKILGQAMESTAGFQEEFGK